MITSSRIYHWINTALLTGVFLTLFGPLTGILDPGFLHVLAAFLFLAALAVMQCAGKKGYLIGAVLLCAMTAIFMFLTGFSESVSYAISWAEWLFDRQKQPAEGLIYYEILLSLLFAGAAFLLQALLERYLKAKAAAALLLLAYLAYCVILSEEVSHPGTALAFVYLILFFVEWRQSRWEKKRKQSLKNQMMWLLPFFAVYGFLLLVLPFQDEPYDWRWAKQAYGSLRESFFTATQALPFGDREDFDTGYTGFSDSASMPGILADRDQEIMTLQTKNGLIPNIYLTGQIYDTFDGGQWTQNGDVPSYGRLLDAFLTTNMCKAYHDSYITDYIRSASLSVRFLKFHTGYLFAPLKTQEVRLQGHRMDLGAMKDHWGFEDQKSYGTEYELDFFQMNTGQEEFYRFLEQAREPSFEEWEQILHEYERITRKSLTLQEVADYEAAVAEVYGQVPLLPDPVQAWLLEVTKDRESDVQKLRAIENALAGYAYTTSPGALPASVSDAGSFLEYFLLQSREGYCVHYATAFVLLARAEGIPARYVQGYLVPMKGKMEITVTSDMAHAWPEVYIEGAGWIPFEPTPGYGQIGHAFWKMKQGTTEPSDSQIQTASPADASPAPEEAETYDASGTKDSMTDGESEEVSTLLRILRMAGLIFPLILLLVVLVWFLDRKAAGWKYRRMTQEEQFLAEMRNMKKLLSVLGYRRRETETIQEFRKETLLYLQDTAALESLVIYEELLYGARRIGKDEVSTAVREKESLLVLLRQRNRFLYFWYRYCTRA